MNTSKKFNPIDTTSKKICVGIFAISAPLWVVYMADVIGLRAGIFAVSVLAA